MNVSLALLADFASKSVDGKLNILGVFNRIYSHGFPAIHPEMKLVVRFELHPAELDQTKKVQIQLRDEDGKTILGFNADMAIEATGEAPRGEMIQADSILSLTGLRVDKPGSYEFVILVNGEVKATVPFKALIPPA